MSFFVKGVVAALKEYPQVNAIIDGEEISPYKPMTSASPSLPKKGSWSLSSGMRSTLLAAIEQSSKHLPKKRAMARSLSTICAAAVSLSQTAASSARSSRRPSSTSPERYPRDAQHLKRPVVVDDQIVIRPMMYVALSYDHRIIDGKEAVFSSSTSNKISKTPHRFFWTSMAETFDLIVIGSGPEAMSRRSAPRSSASRPPASKSARARRHLPQRRLHPFEIAPPILRNYWNALHHSKEHGIDIANVGLNFAQMMQRKQKVVYRL